jgi:hypothetical protein
MRQLRDAIVLTCESLEQQMIHVPLTQRVPVQDVVYVEEDILNPTFSNNTVEHFSKTILLSILVNILERIQLCLSMMA